MFWRMTQVNTKRGVVLGSAYIRPYSLVNAAALARIPGGAQKLFMMRRPELLEPVVRKSILYFDEIECPNNDLEPQDFPEIELLVQQQVVTRRTLYIDRSQVPGSPGDHMSALRSVNTQTFLNLDQAEPAKWVFAPLSIEPGFWPPQILASHEAIEVELSNMLPVPDTGVEYADILDFKSRRHAELHQLRDYLDELHRSVIDSNDLPRSRTAAMNKLDEAFTDLAAVIRESGLRAFHRSVKISLLAGIDTASRAESLGAASSGNVQIAGVLAGLYKFGRTSLLSPVSRAGPLAYIHETATEGVVRFPV
jgi:hypothetical protein